MEALRARGLGVGCGHATWGGGAGEVDARFDSWEKER